MKKIKPILKKSYDGYYAVVTKDGTLKCSCGDELLKLDENTYVCAGGYPMYRFEDGEVVIDKWGNLLLKQKEHNNENNKKQKDFKRQFREGYDEE